MTSKSSSTSPPAASGRERPEGARLFALTAPIRVATGQRTMRCRDSADCVSNTVTSVNHVDHAPDVESDPGEASNYSTAEGPAIVVIGVSGSGKSTVGKSLAHVLAYAFCDADDLHSLANIHKMASGHALSDADRLPWLNAVGRRMLETLAHRRGVVVACSALKTSYRDIIRTYVASSFFVLLDGSDELVRARVAAREGGFMPPSLLTSQFSTLEPLAPGETGVTLDAARSVEQIVQEILTTLSPGTDSVAGS